MPLTGDVRDPLAQGRREFYYDGLFFCADETDNQHPRGTKNRVNTIKI